MTAGIKGYTFLLSFVLIVPSFAQLNVTPLTVYDSAAKKIDWTTAAKKHKWFSPYIMPAMLIGYGLTGLENDGLQNLNFEIKEELYTEHIHRNNHLDNYLQFSPALAVYSLNVLGIKGRHNFIDRTGIYLLSNLILNTTCQVTKTITHIQRPDGSSFTSFPSGHTSEAFASAEFLRQEYRDVSPWYGIAGYAVAATTGYFRMYNNKHWLSDVVAGAGVGIISTKISYWVYPHLKKVLFKNKASDTYVMPSYSNGSFGVGMLKVF